MSIFGLKKSELPFLFTTRGVSIVFSALFVCALMLAASFWITLITASVPASTTLTVALMIQMVAALVLLILASRFVGLLPLNLNSVVVNVILAKAKALQDSEQDGESYSELRALARTASIFLKEDVEDHQKTLRAWNDLVFRKITFSEMSLLNKAGYVLVLFVSGALVAFGFAELLGITPTPLVIEGASEALNIARAAPRWLVGPMAILAGFVGFVFSHFYRNIMTDKWEEGLRELKEDLGID